MMGKCAARPFDLVGSILRSSGDMFRLTVSAGVPFMVLSTDDTRPRSWGSGEALTLLQGPGTQINHPKPLSSLEENKETCVTVRPRKTSNCGQQGGKKANN